jgi:UDP-N-acetylmuramoyl-tripeptide--D-alanyl-D-alanine ligase
MNTIFRKIISYILRVESRLVLKKYKPKVVAITGSVGKTSTKDAVYAVISNFSYVRKSQKSYNSEIGLPLTILGCPNGWNKPMVWLHNIWKGFWLVLVPHKYPKWLVLEVGVGKPGDMKATASWLKTDVVVITAIGETPAHIEFFNSRKHLIEEKSGLIKTLKKDGLLVLNSDDPDVLEMKNNAKHHVMTYGFTEGANLLGSGVDILYEEGEPAGIVYRVDEEGKSLPVMIEGVFGRNHVYASLAALAVASGEKLNMLEAINALKNYEIAPGRMHLLRGIKHSLIIDDTYNSSPFACKSALTTLGEIKKPGRKIAILGDMLELGKHTTDAHKEIGKLAAQNAELLVVVGQRAQAIKEGALEVGMDPEKITQFVNSNEAGEYAKTMIKKNDLILVKGSQGMRMERIVAEILEDKNNKHKLLVRQDKEWLAKV